MDALSPPAAPDAAAAADPSPPRRLVAWLLFVGVLAALSFAGNGLAPHEQEGSRQQHVVFVDLNGDGSFDEIRSTSGFTGPTVRQPRDDLFYRPSTAVLVALQSALMFGVVLLIARGCPKARAFALHRPASWPRAIGSVVGLLVAVYVGLLVFDIAIGSRGHPDQGLPTFWDPSRANAFLLSVAAVAVLVPVVEELTFRGLGFWVLGPYGPRVAVVGTAVAFGLVHGFVVALPVFVLVGFALGWLRSRTGSVYPGMLMHGVFNAVAILGSVAA